MKITHPTVEELEAQRQALLDSLGLTLEELKARVKAGTLEGAEWGVYPEVEAISLLLGDDSCWED